MHRDRVEAAIKVMEQVRDETVKHNKFNMNTWATVRNAWGDILDESVAFSTGEGGGLTHKHLIECGSNACFAGWLASSNEGRSWGLRLTAHPSLYSADVELFDHFLPDGGQVPYDYGYDPMGHEWLISIHAIAAVLDIPLVLAEQLTCGHYRFYQRDLSLEEQYGLRLSQITENDVIRFLRLMLEYDEVKPLDFPNHNFFIEDWNSWCLDRTNPHNR